MVVTINRVTVRRYRFAIVLLLILYWAVSLRHLAIVPAVYEDEPWQASTGWKLATEGVFGSDMFTGYYGMESRYYGYMPIHPLLQAVVFWASGLGLFQARLEPVIMGSLVLALTFSLGRRLFEPDVGLLAVFFLLVVRLTTTTPSQVTGIVFLDIARVARYDMVVPFFGLAALHAYYSAAGRRTWPGYLLAGFLAGLAGLSHLYGLFFAGALGLLCLWHKAGFRNTFALLAGFCLPWLPYLAYVLADLPAWANQTRDYAPRFDLFNWRWYWDNLRREPLRYFPGLGQVGWRYLLRPGFWAAVVATPLALIGLGRRVKQAGRLGDPAPVVLFVPALLLPIAFALLIYLKLINYLVAFLPLLALVVAWGSMALWRHLSPRHDPEWPAGRRLTWLKALMLLLLLAVFVEGIGRIRLLQETTGRTTPYETYISQVRAFLPEQGLILGLHHYWFGLEDLDYRTWAVPLLWQSQSYEKPLSLPAALDKLEPAAVLIDRRMRALFTDSPETGQAVRQWLADRGYELAGVVNDDTYGQMEIYRSFAPP